MKSSCQCMINMKMFCSFQNMTSDQWLKCLLEVTVMETLFKSSGKSHSSDLFINIHQQMLSWKMWFKTKHKLKEFMILLKLLWIFFNITLFLWLQFIMYFDQNKRDKIFQMIRFAKIYVTYIKQQKMYSKKAINS